MKYFLNCSIPFEFEYFARNDKEANNFVKEFSEKLTKHLYQEAEKIASEILSKNNLKH